MIKNDEATNRESCWNKARHDERVFVLLARDAAAPETLRFWANKRIELGKNDRFDPQIVSALEDADRMEDEAKRINYRPHGGGMAGHDEDGRIDGLSSGPIPVLWFTASGNGPNEMAIEVYVFRPEAAIPSSIGLRVHETPGGMIVGDAVAAMVGGGFYMEREQVAELHRRFGAWLETNRT